MPIRTLRELVHGQNVATVLGDTSVDEACRVMRARNIGAILVVDVLGALLGIFTERDAVFRVLVERRDPLATAVAAVMTAAPATLRPDHNAMDALRLMDDGGFRHVPVMESGRVYGIVSRRDFHAAELSLREDETKFWERT
jgi:CBS domain-containing protein